MYQKLIPLLGLLLICGFTGCAGVKNSMRPSTKTSSWNPISALTGDKKKEADEADPVTITAIWKDSTYDKPGSPRIKGFGGRFFFYDKDANPVKAKGELVIYGFDDSKEETDKKGPDKKFVFRESEFQSHYSDSGLGHSYSVWVPWEKVGGTRKMITLIPVFRKSDGSVMKCGQSTTVLPGKEPEGESEQIASHQPYKYLGSSSALAGKAGEQLNVAKQTAANRVQTAVYESHQEFDSRIKTSTISLPPSMAKRIAASRNTQKDGVMTTLKTGAADEVVHRVARVDDMIDSGIVEANSFPSEFESEQPESSASSPVSSPRNVFGAPGSFN